MKVRIELDNATLKLLVNKHLKETFKNNPPPDATTRIVIEGRASPSDPWVPITFRAVYDGDL